MLKTRIEGSNPSLSANQKSDPQWSLFLLRQGGGYLEIPPVRPASSAAPLRVPLAGKRQAAPHGRFIRSKRVALSRYFLAAFTPM
jgi:hypothetical protein